MEITALKGLVLTSIEGGKGDGELVFRADLDRRAFRMYHRQDCCESVWLEEVHGDLTDVLFSPVLAAESRAESPEGGDDRERGDSCTWTFYEIRTVKATITLRWVGRSNGYYSEAVNFEEVEHNYVRGSAE